jgi:hypothetical protein
MVFEKFVVQLLDKYLSDYIENLDYKKLKIDMWSGRLNLIDNRINLLFDFVGNVVLENLSLKPNALVNSFFYHTKIKECYVYILRLISIFQ